MPRGLSTTEESWGVTTCSLTAEGLLGDTCAMDLPRIAITYCTQCRWLLRAAWYQQELLTTFHRELGEVALRPATGGVFRVEVDGALVWDRGERGGFPDLPELKRLVRDLVAPDKPLGHSDRAVEA